jgi:hypothetical protein
MAGEQPEFAPVKPAKKKAWLETYEEHGARLEAYLSAEKERKRQESILANLAPFFLKIDDVSGIPLVFNLATGQVAVREDALGVNAGTYNHRLHIGPDHLRRIRAADGLRLLKTHDYEVRGLPLAFEPERELPAWFFNKSNEPRPELVRVMRWVRLRRLRGRMSSGFADLIEGIKNGLIGIVGFVVIIIAFAILAWIAWYFLSGIAGLLEFGRKQL